VENLRKIYVIIKTLTCQMNIVWKHNILNQIRLTKSEDSLPDVTLTDYLNL
jgi:hypothetical protein